MNQVKFSKAEQQSEMEESGPSPPNGLFSFFDESIMANIFENFDMQECNLLVFVSKQFRHWVNSYRFPCNASTFKRQNPNAIDGEYTLFYYGRKTAPFRCYLHGLSTAQPREYLSLPSGPDTNFSFFPNGGFTEGSALRTSFEKIRLDPVTLQVKTDDFTFATTKGGPLKQIWGNGTVSHVFKNVPYSVARDCSGWQQDSGRSHVDLRQTPFCVASLFGPRGFQAKGSSRFDHDNQVVELRGGGCCGGCYPQQDQTCGQGPSGGWALQLAFVQT